MTEEQPLHETGLINNNRTSNPDGVCSEAEKKKGSLNFVQRARENDV